MPAIKKLKFKNLSKTLDSIHPKQEDASKFPLDVFKKWQFVLKIAQILCKPQPIKMEIVFNECVLLLSLIYLRNKIGKHIVIFAKFIFFKWLISFHATC